MSRDLGPFVYYLKRLRLEPFPHPKKVCAAVQVVAKYQNIFPKPAFLNCLCTKSFATEMAATHFYCWLPLIHKITQH